MPNNTQPNEQDIKIEWSNFVSFFRQLSHDVRNHLNAVELQTAYLNEIAEDAELKDEIKRLREMVAEVSRSLQKVISKVTPISPTRIRYRCGDLIEDVRQKLASTGSESKIEWAVQLGDESFEIDPQLVQDAMLELLDNAARQQSGGGPTVATAKITDGKFEFALREPKKDFDGKPETWGRDPLRQVGRGHYGLGLNRVRMIVEAHAGNFSASYDPQMSTLTNRIVLPLQASG